MTPEIFTTNTIKFLTLFCIFWSSPTVAESERKLIFSAPPATIWARSVGNKLQGPLIELTEALFNEIGIQSESLSYPWARALHNLEMDEVDVIAMIFFTEERTKFLDYSIPYMTMDALVYVKKGLSFQFDQISDLRKKKVQ